VSITAETLAEGCHLRHLPVAALPLPRYHHFRLEFTS
jgi:hypothetical protein